MPAAPQEKRELLTEQMVVRFTEREMERVVELAEQHDVSQARVIRVAVQRLLEEEQATPSPRKKRRKK